MEYGLIILRNGVEIYNQAISPDKAVELLLPDMKPAKKKDVAVEPKSAKKRVYKTRVRHECCGSKGVRHKVGCPTLFTAPEPTNKSEYMADTEPEPERVSKEAEIKAMIEEGYGDAYIVDKVNVSKNIVDFYRRKFSPVA